VLEAESAQNCTSGLLTRGHGMVRRHNSVVCVEHRLRFAVWRVFNPRAQRRRNKVVLKFVVTRASNRTQNNFSLGCLHPVACVRSGDGILFYPSTQRDWRRLISVVRPSSGRKYIIS
jgi:hypothetical protein